MINVVINGFGRIGRHALRIAFGRKKLKVVAINDTSDNALMAHLLRHDTSYGRYEHEVGHYEDGIIVDGKKIPTFHQKDPLQLPWKKLKVDVVLECTGKFTSLDGASLHVQSGAKKVIISAPAKGEGVHTYVLGVNGGRMRTEKQPVINNASCTTNCISPVMSVLEDTFGIAKAMMTTVHSYTSDQRLHDGSHKDPRRARAAAANIIPTTTGAAVATADVIPELAGLFDGLAIRVPTMTVSLSDITAVLKRDVTKEAINAAFVKAAASKQYQGILAVTNEELVSSDFIGSPYSATVDLGLTNVVGGNLVKVIAWYDNEFGYSCRLVEMAESFGS